MCLKLNNIYQIPYVVQDRKNLVKRKQDEENSAAKARQEEQSSSNSKSRGLQYVDNQPKVTPAYQKAPYEVYNANLSYNTGVNSLSQTDLRSSNINIAQILKDFKNTAAAIGTPAELSEEGSLNLI